MIKGITRSGFEFEIAENVMDNMELVDILADDETDMSFRISKITQLVLGKEQKKRFYDHHRTEDGRVPVEEVYEDISEIFQSFKQGKNS